MPTSLSQLSGDVALNYTSHYFAVDATPPNNQLVIDYHDQATRLGIGYLNVSLDQSGGAGKSGVRSRLNDNGDGTSSLYLFDMANGNAILTLSAAYHRYERYTWVQGGTGTLEFADATAGPWTALVAFAMSPDFTAPVVPNAELCLETGGAGTITFVPQLVAPPVVTDTSLLIALNSEATQVTATVQRSNGSTRTPGPGEVTYTASAGSVSSSGAITKPARTSSVQTVTIGATLGGLTATAVTYTVPALAVAALTATPRATNGTAITGRTIWYASTYPEIASVSSDGTITPHAVGVTYIVASVSRRDGRVVSKRCKVTVTA